ncbi:MAG: hypothetical protein ACYDD1_21545 [Caulobacteraceae bacterium]
MADLRITSGAPVPSSGLTTRAQLAPERSEAARAAQRAFFDAAMNKTAATGAAKSAAATAQTNGVASSNAVAIARTPVHIDNTAPPTRMLRPGSLLDITV